MNDANAPAHTDSTAAALIIVRLDVADMAVSSLLKHGVQVTDFLPVQPFTAPAVRPEMNHF